MNNNKDCRVGQLTSEVAADMKITSFSAQQTDYVGTKQTSEVASDMKITYFSAQQTDYVGTKQTNEVAADMKLASCEWGVGEPMRTTNSFMWMTSKTSVISSKQRSDSFV